MTNGKMKSHRKRIGVAEKNNTHKLILRFGGFTIPKNAVINRAYLQFTASAKSKDDSAHATIFCSAVKTESFVPDSPNTSNSELTQINWNIPAWKIRNNSGLNEQTPDLKEILQKLSDDTETVDLSFLEFIISGTGSRSAVSFDQSPENAAHLFIDYTLSDENAGNEQTDTDTDHTEKKVPFILPQSSSIISEETPGFIR